MAKQTFSVGQVLSAAQMTSLQATAMGGGAPVSKTASYTLVAADAGTVIQMNSASPTTITVNTALFAAGDSVQIQNIGAGVCTITAGTATVTTAGSLALSQWEGGFLYFTSASAAIFFDVVQSSGMTNPMTTAGDIIYGGASGTPTRLGVGSTGNVLTVSGGNPIWAAPAGGGKVLQVVQGTLTGLIQSTSTTYADTGLTVSITPSATTSKVLVIATLQGVAKTAGNAQTRVKTKLLRGSTTISNAERTAYTNADGTLDIGTQTYTSLDSPATTSSTTYKVQYASGVSGQTIYINDYASTDDMISTIIAMEIGA